MSSPPDDRVPRYYFFLHSRIPFLLLLRSDSSFFPFSTHIYSPRVLLIDSWQASSFERPLMRLPSRSIPEQGTPFRPPLSAGEIQGLSSYPSSLLTSARVVSSRYCSPISFTYSPFCPPSSPPKGSEVIGQTHRFRFFGYQEPRSLPPCAFPRTFLRCLRAPPLCDLFRLRRERGFPGVFFFSTSRMRRLFRALSPSSLIGQSTPPFVGSFSSPPGTGRCGGLGDSRLWQVGVCFPLSLRCGSRFLLLFSPARPGGAFF